MRKFTILILLIISAMHALAQDDPKVAAKLAPAGVFLGSLNLMGEYNFGKNSLTAKIGIPINASYTSSFAGRDASFSMKATSFMAGYRTYFSGKSMRGLYFEPYFKYLHDMGEGQGNATLDGKAVVMSFTNEYNGLGIGAQLGAQFMIGRHFIIDFYFLGPEINSSTNTFKAIDISSALPWTFIQANDAEQDVRDFINKYPFVRNKASVMVDQTNKTVVCNFRGALPGFRIGFALGFAF